MSSHSRRKRAKDAKVSIAIFIMLSGMQVLINVISLGSIVSTVCEYLPNSTVVISYESAYFNLVLSCLLMIVITLLMWIDAFAGEHVPLLGNVFKKEKKNETEEEEEYFEE